MTRQSIDPFAAFYRTRPLPCPYLDGRLESRIFTHLTADGAHIQYEALTAAGFRRSHDMAYRPACPACDACVPVRVVVQEFAPSRSLRRVIKVNADLAEHDRPARATGEQYRLFARYLASRHGGGEMADMEFAEYRAMVEDSPVETGILEYCDPLGRLVGASLWDRLGDGLSAVYSFFDPAQERRGLGNFMVLRLIERAREAGLAHLYLGYWIAESLKMSYKARFRPVEALGPEGWRLAAPRGLIRGRAAVGPGACAPPGVPLRAAAPPR
ncbi:MAG: arginyltransferase [Alphaproteobacteria bacterium]